MRIKDVRAKARKVIKDISKSSFIEEENLEGERVNITCLGTVFNLYPSGKYYAPFANGNVSLCPRCHGGGRITSKNSDSSNWKIASGTALALRMESISKYGKWAEGKWPQVIIDRLKKLDSVIKTTAPTKTCPYCNGIGSREAYEDEVFGEALEEAARKKGGWITSGEGDPCDIFYGENIDEVVVEDDRKFTPKFAPGQDTSDGETPEQYQEWISKVLEGIPEVHEDEE